ncbi:hypothetical protein CC1G_09446 [Coprinopsis cinerea okayama7|uniref:Uncharacterized protein n=1 Tax=Coprinopsis cinerea (strain Okayama-7 / 130 / ATCC MYA-4618 / FGSC 9003) TaxID=240176 RepID=A8NIM5_COPC7|nr:hypothetical protein CC1G_09446 [Coprinopsis cinerea okayama7\|eukprot:XP_001834032.1 hypothetical protein CC1G_09446 [Coprinopsis cinerea okayama7\
MFSSFAQYLPSALQNTIAAPISNNSGAQELPPQSNFDPTTDDEGDEEELIRQASREQERRLQNDDEGEEDRRKPKSKKERDGLKMANETFIFVRPPPSKSNHPLNLQVQLVPPNARAPSGITPVNDEPTTPTSASSVNTVSTESGRSVTSVARTASTRSTRSNYSTNHSSTSTTSFASDISEVSGTSSATSSSSARSSRRIIPLYNLQAHNVLTNTIVDAGTDAKVAKFQKRGLELIDLAILEPVEVWGVRSKEAKREGMKITVDEMGAIVHQNHTLHRGSVTGANRGSGFLQPSGARKETSSRPATPSGSSVSLASNSTHVSHALNNPHVMVSPPHERSLAPPASAPPSRDTFPLKGPPPTNVSDSSVPSQAPTGHARSVPPPIDVPDRQNPPTSPQSHISTDTSFVSTTPTKKSSGLFGKLKFNTKRNSLVTPAVPPATEGGQLNDFGQFAMAPLGPGDLNHRAAGNASTARVPASPLSGNSQSSNTPTQTPITPRNAQNEGQISPTPTVHPLKVGDDAGTVNRGAGHTRNLSLTGAITRSKNRFMSGIKGHSPSPSPMSEREGGSTVGPHTAGMAAAPSGGARSLFGKIAAGISGQNNTANGNGVVEGNGLFAPQTMNGSPRVSTENSNPVGGIKSKFERILQHSSSQQFIGNSATPDRKLSVESLKPQQPLPRPLSQLLTQPVIPPQQPSIPPPAQSQPAQGAAVVPHVTLRQLQLRPPVLGIQPTYVSASQPLNAPAYPSQQPSTISLTSTTGQPPRMDEVAARAIRQVESRSTLSGETEESVSEANRKRSGSRPGSARNSLNLDRDAPSGSGSGPGMTGKEKALMYVWLVRRWLKKRGVGGPWDQGQPSENRGSLFSQLVGRDKDRGDRDPGKRGSWHAGAGIGLIPSITGLAGSHSQQPSTSSAYGNSPSGSQVQLQQQSGQQLVLGPVVGGGFEVRFEWKRARAKKEKRGRKKDKGKNREKKGEVKARDMLREGSVARGEEETPRPPQTSTMEDGRLVEMSPQRMSASERRRINRTSNASLSSLPPEVRDGSPNRGSPSRRGVNASSTSSKARLALKLRGRGEEEEDGGDWDDESDAEDSETPWVCTLKIRRVAPGGVGVSAGDGLGLLSPSPGGEGTENGGVSGLPVQEKEQILRLKVGTLSQTPHHPKVVAMLKIPFPLPDVEVERMEIVPRKGFVPQSPNEGDQKEPYKGLTLTAEEIKDVVCSTGLWVAVREGFGGVGKVNRKGDGWKIRG